MNIVHISTVHDPMDNRILFKQCASLARKGHDVTFLCRIDTRTETHGVHLVPVGNYRSRMLRIVLSQIRVLRQAYKIKPDIFHLHDPELLFLGIILRLCGQSVVYDMHENLPKQIMSKRWIPRRLRSNLASLTRGIERVLLPFFHVIFAERSYKKNYPYVRNFTDVLNFPDLSMLTELRDKVIKDTQPTVGYVGGVSVERGIENILKALDLINLEGREPIKFICIGPVHSNELLKQLESRQWVELHGFTPVNEAYRVVSRAWAGLAILKAEPNYIDSYPTKIFEYMALGMPVICSDFPLYRDVVCAPESPCGIAVNPDDISAIQRAILNIVDGQKSRQFSLNSIHEVETKYSWWKEFEKLEVVYSDISE